MDEFASTRRERRHRKPAAVGAAAARAEYGDVFGGPPRFAAPFAGVPDDYSEVFGGVAASCSIPFLDLPPVISGDGEFAGGARFDYGEIFGRFDFGEVAASYEELFERREMEREEIASSNGNSRSSIKRGSSQQEIEPPILSQNYPNEDHAEHLEEDHFSSISIPSDGGQHFSMSYNKTSRGRPEDPVGMTTCIIEPSADYVVDSCNSTATNDPRGDNGTMTNGEKGKGCVPSSSSDGTKSYGSDFIVDQKQPMPTCPPISGSSPRGDNGTMTNGEKGKKCPARSYSDSTKSYGSDFIVDQKQPMPTCPPISGNGHANKNHQQCASNPSVSSDEALSPDYPFLSVSDISLQTQPLKVPPPSRPPPKLLNKQEKFTGKGDIYRGNHKDTPTTSSGQAVTNNSVPQAAGMSDLPSFFDYAVDASAAAAAMKEAMEFAEARLKAAKELMERKGESFKVRKRSGHLRSSKSMEIKGRKVAEEVQIFEKTLSLKKLTKEDKNLEDLAIQENHRKIGSMKLAQRDNKEKGVLLSDEPLQMTQSGFGSYQASSKIEKSCKWRSGDEFYELINHDQKCKTKTAVEKGDNDKITKAATKLSKDEACETGTAAMGPDMERYEKLWEDNDNRVLEVKHVNLKEDGTTCKKGEDKKVSTIVPEPSMLAESVANPEVVHDSHFEGHVRAQKAQESCDEDKKVEIPCESQIAPKLDCVQEMSSAFPEACISGDYATDLRELSHPCSEETPAVVTSQESSDEKMEPEMSHVNETLGKCEGMEKAQEPPEISNLDDIQGCQVGKVQLDETAVSYGSKDCQRGSSTVDREGETYDKEKLFSFENETHPQNESEKVIEVPNESPSHEGVQKVDADQKCEHGEDSEETILEWNAEHPHDNSDVRLESPILANGHEETEELNVFEVACKLIKSNSALKGTPHPDVLVNDPEKLQKTQGSKESGEPKNRSRAATDDSLCDCKEKEKAAAQTDSIENSKEKAHAEETLRQHSHEDQRTSKSDDDKEPNDFHREGNQTLDSRDEFIKNAANDVPMVPVNTDLKDPQACFLEMNNSMKHSSENPASIYTGMSEKTTPGLGLQNPEEDYERQTGELRTEKSTRLEEEKNMGNEMEKRRGQDSQRASDADLKNQQSPQSEKSNSIPKYVQNIAPDSAQACRKDAPAVQRTEERESRRKLDKEKQVPRRFEEEKERERKLETEREQVKGRERRKLEEEKEREREREKDRLAVERATREAHERAFAEARERAERIALERITAARQRASAETREKEEKAYAEASEKSLAEKASREAARLKVERAAVERATAEARERAIEKAMAGKAAADARERMERFKSFKESFKDNSKDVRCDTQFQRTGSNNYGRNMDYSNQVVEVESALRHKARLERHQRTAERAAKALAEKNMRDMLAQREQSEKHRLAEFLDPEVKRWSNGKEGNLRALLSTLQYILGPESGWQPLPLTDLITAAAVKKAYRKATLCVHPDKLQQRGATIRQKYICEKVFDLLKEAWNKFNSEER